MRKNVWLFKLTLTKNIGHEMWSIQLFRISNEAPHSIYIHINASNDFVTTNGWYTRDRERGVNKK